MRRLITNDDILMAARQRVSGVSPDQLISELVATHQWLGSLSSTDQIAETDPVTIGFLDQLKRPNERRNTWGLLMALIALESYRSGDTALFYRSGCEVIQFDSQAHRRACRAPGDDALTTLISAYLADHPDAQTSHIANELAELAGNYAYESLVEFDCDKEVLTYHPAPEGEALRDIKIPALHRRIQRVRALSN